jgi:hypothetical protein
VQDLPPRSAQLRVDHFAQQIMGEAIAAQVPSCWFSGLLLAQEAMADGLLQGLDTCLHLDLGYLP